MYTITKQFIFKSLAGFLVISASGLALSNHLPNEFSQTAGAEETSTPKVYRDFIKPHWFSDNTRFWYRNDLADGMVEFVLVDASTASRAPAFDHARVAAALSELLGEPVDDHRLPVEELVYDEDAQQVTLLGFDRSWLLNLQDYSLKEIDGSAGIESIPFDRNLRHSRSLGGDTYITFVNRCTETVKLYWVDGSGGRHLYAELVSGERHRQHTFVGHVWLVTTGDEEILAVFDGPSEEATAVIDYRRPDRRPEIMDTSGSIRRMASTPSPSGLLAVFVRNHNLWLRDLKTGEEHQLSFDGSAGDSYGKDVQRARLMEMDYEAVAPADSAPDVTWSPDSHHLIARRTRVVPERRVYMIRSAPDDQLQPRLESYPYLKPGDEIPVGIPNLFDIEKRTQIPLDQDLFAQPWDINHYKWDPDGSQCFFLYNQRGHQVMRVIAVNALTGQARTVVEEQCETFFDYQGKTYVQHLETSDELIWMSERDGWNHLYLYDRKKGRVKKQITSGDWVVRGVDRMDEVNRLIWFRASGTVPGEDPYYVHLCRVDLDGRNLKVLTGGDGTHRYEWSPDNRYLIDRYSRIDVPPVNVLRDGENGDLICELERADVSELEAAAWRSPERFVAKGRDGETDIYGIIHRPQDFDPDASYPVIESIYAGPHGYHVPKGFRSSYRQQELANRGFIVVQIDGMGTNWRSKSFHDVCWQNIVDGGFPDRILWMQAAAREYPYLDLSRVGIYGGSAGGQNALAALLTHGDFYKAAMADCGCHDNRMDKIWWNEQWMGYPVGPQYAENSNVSLAHQLQGSLLLIVGELDRNVDPASTMQVVDALIEADKDFELLVMPGMGHGAASSEYGRRRTFEFFQRHLQGE